MKDLLQSLIALSEGETKSTDKGRVHKGEYGNKYGKEDVRDQYGHKIGKKDKGAEAKKEAPKKGRGRPKKDTGETGAKFDSSELANVFGGKKPKKEIGKVSKKHSLKEFMESVEDTKHAEAVMEGMFGDTVDHTSVAANLGKLAKVIKSVQTPEQFAVAQKYAQRMSGTIMKHQHDNSGFGSGLKANLGVMRAISADLAAKAKELGIPYDPLAETQVNEVDPMNFDSDEDYYDAVNSIDMSRFKGDWDIPDEIASLRVQLRNTSSSYARDRIQQQIDQLEKIYYGDDDLEEAEAITTKPMPGATQLIGPDGQALGTADAQTANTIKQAAAQGKLNLGGQQDMQEGKKAKPDFKDVDKDGNKKESWKKAEKDKKKVAEGRDLESSEYLDEKVAKILAREKPGMDTIKSNDAFYAAIYNELIACGLTPKAARYKVSYDEDFISDVASAYAHYQKNPTLDEGDIPRSQSDSIRAHTQHALSKPTSDFTTVGQEPGAMAAPRGARTQINRPVPEPTPWGTDPIAAASDRAFNFIDSLKKKTPFSESTNMKDIQIEGWAKQLNGLLNEGLTVSSSTGQQGQPNTVTVSATEGDADQLMQVLRSAGIGGFGAEQPAPEIGYGVAQGGEEEPTGTGTEPQASPDVVGDDGDMLDIIKKMAGLGGGDAEVVAVGGDEEGQDYEDEESADDTALQPADAGEDDGQEELTGAGEESEEGSEEQDSEESSDEEEQTDEGNAFTGKLKQTPQGGNFKMGDKEYKDTSSIEEGEGTCNECGMYESECGCDHEQVEENFANSPQDPAEQELMKLKALLSMGGDLHKMKSSQAMGNPVRVAESETINDWKKLSGIK